MKNIFYKGALAVLALGSLASCADDYLDTAPTTSITTAIATSNTENITRAMQGICRGMYGQYQNENQFVSGEPIYMLYGEVQSNDYFSTTFKAMSWEPVINMNYINLNQYVTSSYMWMYAYTMIGQANDILPEIDAAEGSQEDKDFLKASFLTLRAHGYWRLLQCYAPRWQDSNNGEALSVVLRLNKEVGPAPLATMNQVIDQMYSDLDLAIQLYTTSGKKRTFKWEPNINVAYGEYARLALLKQDWQKAYDMSMKAIEGFPLMSNEQVQGGFADENEEWIWGAVNMNPLYYFSFGIWYACNGYNSYAQPYCGAGAINIDLYHKIPETDVRKNWFLGDEGDTPLKADYWWNVNTQYADKNYAGMTNQSLTSERLRRNLMNWISERNPDPSVFSNAYSIPQGQDVQDPKILYALGAQFKFWAKGMGSVNVDQGDVVYMRSAEFYLTAAEAAAELGNTAEAQRLMNELNGKRDASYSCTASGQALIDEVRTYRRIELWGEGFNWFDFKRWNMPIDRREWIEGDVTSGNFPKGVAIRIEPTQYQGWKIAVPRAETEYNGLIK